MTQKICSEEDLTNFKLLKSIFTLSLIVSCVGVFFFLYHLIGVVITDQINVQVWQMDSTTPPYIGIMLVVVVITSAYGLRNIKKIKDSFCP